MFRNALRLALGIALAAGSAAARADLPDLGPAAPFRLSTQDGAPLALADLRGKVVLLAFIYASCKDVCRMETAKMVKVQDGLGSDFGRRVRFLSVTIDPEHDTPAVLKKHARQFGAHRDGWSFLTGSPAAVRQVARDYGVVFRKSASGVEHNTLASIIDGQGHLRVQYMGVTFEPDEMLADLRGLLRGGGN